MNYENIKEIKIMVEKAAISILMLDDEPFMRKLPGWMQACKVRVSSEFSTHD